MLGWTTIRIFFCLPPFQPSQCWEQIVGVMLLCSMLEINDVVLYCIVLYCIVLYCIVLYCIVLYCIVLYCIVLYCIVLYCIVLYCIVLYCIVLYSMQTRRMGAISLIDLQVKVVSCFLNHGVYCLYR